METNFTINFNTLYLPIGGYVGLGVCDKDRVLKNNHVSAAQRNGIGVYLIFNSGSIYLNLNLDVWHNKTGETGWNG